LFNLVYLTTVPESGMQLALVWG